MPREIERKFLIDPARLGPLEDGKLIRQGFLPTSGTTVARIRISDRDAFLTIKGKTTGITRLEYEYPIPLADAQEMLAELCTAGLIEKTRYMKTHAAHTWEIDVFEGDNAGLIVAEVELASEDAAVVLPEWVTTEVTDDPRYYNANLSRHPYRLWKD